MIAVELVAGMERNTQVGPAAGARRGRRYVVGGVGRPMGTCDFPAEVATLGDEPELMLLAAVLHRARLDRHGSREADRFVRRVQGMVCELGAAAVLMAAREVE